jgi:hypothetical protein
VGWGKWFRLVHGSSGSEREGKEDGEGCFVRAHPPRTATHTAAYPNRGLKETTYSSSDPCDQIHPLFSSCCDRGSNRLLGPLASSVQAAKLTAKQRCIHICVQAGLDSFHLGIALISFPFPPPVHLSSTLLSFHPSLFLQPTSRISKRYPGIASVLDHLRLTNRSRRISRCARSCHARQSWSIVPSGEDNEAR